MWGGFGFLLTKIRTHSCEGLEKVLVGEDVSKGLDVPAKFRVIVTRRPKYAYRNRDGVVQAPASARIGLPL